MPQHLILLAFSVAISGETIIVGAVDDQVGANFSQGSAYIFVMNGNTTPSIAAMGRVTRQQGSAQVTATIATVFDSEDPLSYLNITAASAPAGINVTNLTNNNGVIAAAISAGFSASPGNSFVILQAAINQQLYRLLFSGSANSTGDARKLTLGEAIKQAKPASTDPDIRRTWILLGDPTLRLK
jgi:hypothetical protein